MELENNDFWKFVEDADYAGNNFSHDASRESLIKKGYTNPEKYNNDLESIKEKLKKSFITEVGRRQLGDDGLDDLVSYIISNGKSEVDEYLTKPELFRKHTVDTFIPESFTYCFFPLDANEKKLLPKNKSIKPKR